MELCGRCARPVRHPESCWVCVGPLCEDCWEIYGVCSRAECCALQAELILARTHDKRREIMSRPPMDGRKAKH